MTVTHIVSFGFNRGTSPDAIKKLCDELLALKDNCIHASTKKPYLLSLKGGRDMSIEGFQSGHTHVFVSEFASEAERNHYVREDPVHRAFVEKWILSSDSIVEKAFVVDFVAGKFEER
ncbi:hypothetical protein E4U37_005997 [Claviceps purpurea]|nr:hypothetical protein E4U37_005997 [Claviceps purpurea]